MILKLDEKATAEVIAKCEKCQLFKVEKIKVVSPMVSLQIGRCPIHGEVLRFLDYSHFAIEFDSRNCKDFISRNEI